MPGEWADRIAGWLREAIADSDKPLDDAWEVEVKRTEQPEGEDLIWVLGENPRLPYRLVVRLHKKFASLTIYTGVETAVMDSDQRLALYRKLLLMSGAWKMAKFCLAGEDEEVTITTDLDLSCMNREEFSDALTVTIFALHDMVEKLDLEEAYGAAQLQHVADIVKEKAEAGQSRAQIREYLVKTFEVSDRVAGDIVDNVLEKEGELGDKPSFRYHQ
ncbi:MAG: hypothetical protein PHU95_00595 [Candidatus Thermoplasmatota archaeon]|nr:hypothetical protein [Candidatus Thermoplasmatota archaeon]MDD5777935.1 hypothetical protein [Candidatus Thermoplasmatota archaeon]